MEPVTHLDILVLVAQVHEPVVGPHGLAKLAHVHAHDDEVLPDLPVLEVALERLLQGPECLCPERTTSMGSAQSSPLSMHYTENCSGFKKRPVYSHKLELHYLYRVTIHT